MEKRTKEYFEKELEDILLIHFDAKYYLKDAQYLINPHTNEEKEAAINNSIVKRIINAFWQLGIIEIAKLFQKSKNQHYNLLNYLEELIANYNAYDWIKDLPKEKLENWLALLNSAKMAAIIKKVSTQRDNYFAHTDKNPETKFENIQLTFTEINELLKLTESIIYELEAYCLKVEMDLEISGMECAGNILEALIALKEKREVKMKKEWDEYIKERNNKNST